MRETDRLLADVGLNVHERRRGLEQARADADTSLERGLIDTALATLALTLLIAAMRQRLAAEGSRPRSPARPASAAPPAAATT